MVNGFGLDNLPFSPTHIPSISSSERFSTSVAMAEKFSPESNWEFEIKIIQRGLGWWRTACH